LHRTRQIPVRIPVWVRFECRLQLVHRNDEKAVDEGSMVMVSKNEQALFYFQLKLTKFTHTQLEFWELKLPRTESSYSKIPELNFGIDH